MELFLILVLVAGGTHALFPVDETTCNLTKNTCLCSALLEGTVYIQVTTNASGREVKCLKVLPSGTITVFNLKKGKITDEKFNNRLHFIVNNGTLKLTRVRRDDSGQYRVEVFNSDGVQEENITFTLDVEDSERVEGVETYCDGRQDGVQCYGALGGTVDIQLMDSTSEIFRFQLLKESLKILNVRNNKVLPLVTERRAPFFPSNGTFRINCLSRNNGGKYSLETFDSDGKSSGERTLWLFIQAPVSSVLLVSQCLSQGEMRVSCSSEGGDSPQYSWTLDGCTLTDAELISGNNESNIITLKQHVSGRLVCSVRNNVSNVSKEEMISTCGFIFINCTSINGTQISGWVYEASKTQCIDSTTEPISTTQTTAGLSWFILGLKAVVVIMSFSGIFIYFIWKKKKILEGSAVPQMMETPQNSVLVIEMSTYSNI